MAKQIQIGELVFSTKKAAKDFIREIVSKYDIKDSLAADDFSFISDLLAIHPESDQKIGCGIARVFIDMDAQYKTTKCFYVERLDGSSTDFSWISCIDGKNIRQEKFTAFRYAIVDQILSFKNEQLQTSLSCPYTMEKLEYKNSHVDHESPWTFYSLVNNFIRDESINILDVKTSESEDNQFTTSLIDKDFVERWRQYHLKNARLRVISKTANLSHAKKS